MANRKKPEIRFPAFEGDWELRKLGDVTSSYSGGTPSASNKSYYGGKIPFIRSAEVNSDSTELHLTEEGLNNSSAKMVEVGDILYALYGATSGEVGISRISGAINQAILAIKPNENHDSRFIMQWLRLQKQKIIDKYLQGGQGNLSGSIVKDLHVSFPSFEEQKKIGEFFKGIDDLLTLKQQELTTLKQTKKGFLQKMFPKEGEKVPEVRFPGFTDDWELRKLKELAHFSKGNGYTKDDLIDFGSPIILYGRLYTKYQTIIDSVDTFVNQKDKSVISKGDEVIVPASGETSKDISRASVIGKPGLIIGGDLNIINPKKSIDSIFLALTISNGTQQKEMTKRAQGKSVVHLRNSDLKEVNLFYPELEEQKKISIFFNQLDNTITLHQRELELLKLTKKAFLQKLLV